MSDGSYDLLVIGGGVGGLITSTGAAKLGLKAALVEKRAPESGDFLHARQGRKTMKYNVGDVA